MNDKPCVIESMEIDCSNCLITLKLRMSVSLGRFREICESNGWFLRYDDEIAYCSVCRKEFNV